VIPPARLLSPDEAALWHEQGVDTPSTHLLSQAAVRQAGGTTELKLAILLMQFPDFPADPAHTPQYYEDLFFSHGVRPGGSVAEFLEASSHGRLHLTGEVRGWFTTPENHNWYTNSLGGLGYYPLNSQRLVEDALWAADPTLNFAHFDTEGPDGVPDSGDDDELIDGLVVIHAGAGREGGSTPNDFVSVYWWTQQRVPVDGVFGRFFILTPEAGEIGIHLHELGHLLGLPDLYDRDGGSYGLGAWSLMSGGWNLQQGAAPADFDAWSKSVLGFTDVVNLTTDRKALSIAPEQTSGTVYRLWRAGATSTEYFLLENRPQSGLDHALPGGGIHIYHVDEDVHSNNVPTHYKVALEQADGLFQLENRFNDPSFGDEGDPFREGDSFNRYSDPSSMGYDGVDSYVTVYNIIGPEPDGTMTADLLVEPGAVVEIPDVSLVELEGNGDGLLTEGETAGIVPHIQVARTTARNMVLRAESLDPLGELQASEESLGDVLPGALAEPGAPFPLRIGGPLPSDPYGLPVRLTLSWDDAPPRTLPIEVGLGTRLGLTESFEGLQNGWTHAAIRPTAIDQWKYGPLYGQYNSAGYKCGEYEYGFLKGIDAALVSPPVLLPPSAMLEFDQQVDIINPDTTLVQAAGRVEVSVNGGDWQVAEPVGGYPTYFGGTHPEWIGQPVFSGRLEGGRFHHVQVPLGQYTGLIRVRFRFHSEVKVQGGQSWHIDNVSIVSAVTPVRMLSATARVEGDDVRLSWELGDPLPARLRWRRGGTRENGIPVGEGWLAADTRSLVDPGAARELPARYWLDAQDREGNIESWGPLTAAAVPVPLTWSVRQNPAR